MTFIRAHISDTFSHFKFQFISYDFDSEEIWQWCLDTFGPEPKWMVMFNGVLGCPQMVVIQKEEDALLFMMRWM